MPKGDVHSSGYLVTSHLGLAYCLLVETNSLPKLVSIFPDSALQSSLWTSSNLFTNFFTFIHTRSNFVYMYIFKNSWHGHEIYSGHNSTLIWVSFQDTMAPCFSFGHIPGFVKVVNLFWFKQKILDLTLYHTLTVPLAWIYWRAPSEIPQWTGLLIVTT